MSFPYFAREFRRWLDANARVPFRWWNDVGILDESIHHLHHIVGIVRSIGHFSADVIGEHRRHRSAHLQQLLLAILGSEKKDDEARV